MKQANIPIAPTCTFCGQLIEKPLPPTAEGIGECKIGHCQCGAVFASDPTGLNVGNAMVECLASACNGNWDLAWNLLPDDDYLTGRLENYDEQTNQVVEVKNLDGRLVRGILYFVRLHTDAAEIAKGSKDKKETSIAPDIPPMEPERDPAREKQRASKSRVAELVDANDIDGLVDMCFDDVRTIRFIQRLLYDPDESKRWSCINTMGLVCARFSTRNPGPVSDLLHRLFEASSDSAASSWGLTETIGAVIAGRTDIYGAFTRHLLRYAGDPSTQGPMLWSLGTIAEKRPDLIRRSSFYKILGFISHPDPVIKVLMLRILGRINAKENIKDIEPLLTIQDEVTIYEAGKPVTAKVAEFALEALNLINQEGE